MTLDGLSLQDSFNRTVQTFAIYLEDFVSVSLQAASNLYNSLADAAENCLPPNAFTPLQLTLLKVVFILILGTLGLIVYSWRVYGHVITEKFVRPSTLKEIEELKLSVAKLKLPKEHSPRI